MVCPPKARAFGSEGFSDIINLLDAAKRKEVSRIPGRQRDRLPAFFASK
jgi:hypothetical protein